MKTVVMIPLHGLCKCSDCYGAFSRNAFSLALNAINFMQGLCCQIAFATMGTTHHRHAFDDKKRCAFPVTP